MFGVSRFNGRIAVVAGVEHPLGVSLVQRLAAFGATVVAIGEDEQSLMDLAGSAPARIETLCFRPGRRDVIALLHSTWGAEPLDIFLDFMPLRAVSGRVTPAEVFVRSAGLAAAFAAGIKAGRATAVLAVPSVTAGMSPEQKGRSAGYAALARRFGDTCKPGRFLGLRLPICAMDWSQSACLSAGDVALMLCHPVSRGVRAGSVIDWAHGVDVPNQTDP